MIVLFAAIKINLVFFSLLCDNGIMKTDIEIAREARLNKIAEIANGLGITDDDLIPYGKYMAKIPYDLIDDARYKKII